MSGSALDESLKENKAGLGVKEMSGVRETSEVGTHLSVGAG